MNKTELIAELKKLQQSVTELGRTYLQDNLDIPVNEIGGLLDPISRVEVALIDSIEELGNR
tara:strand:+ start:10050 stop:10232 length:183 start_codon:yes stop_codon:yes gene_type:complete